MINVRPSKKGFKIWILQIVVRHFIRDSYFIITFNVDNIRMNVGLQKGSDNFSLRAYVFEFLKQYT